MSSFKEGDHRSGPSSSPANPKPPHWPPTDLGYVRCVPIRGKDDFPRSAHIAGRTTRLPVAPFALDESKLQEPPARTGFVAREALVARLLAGPTTPVLAVTAPAGYGKTSFLAQWAERKRPRVAWVSLDVKDNDPTVLLTYLSAALDRVEPIAPKTFRSFASPGTGIADLVGLTSSISAMAAPVLIVLDHAEALTGRECRDMVTELALRIPVGSQLAIGSRHEAPVRVPQLRTQRAITEVGLEDLAMNEEEARLLLVSAGVQVSEDDSRLLHERTEGWPAGLYLAALAMNAGSRGIDVAGRLHRRRSIHGRLSALRVPRSRVRAPMSASSLAHRSSNASAGRCAMPSEVVVVRLGFSIASSDATCWWCRSTAGASGIATITCSASCCTPN